MPEIGIGQTVDIVVEHGMIKPSTVRDIVDDKIVLLQIVPPLSKGYIRKDILITYVTGEDRCVRRCFRATVEDIREGYVTIGRGFPVIIVKRISSDEMCDLRVHERRRAQPDTKIYFGADLMEVIDISIGSAHLVRTKGNKPVLAVGNDILLSIHDSTGSRYDRLARVLRLWHTKGENGPEHLAVTFVAEKTTGK